MSDKENNKPQESTKPVDDMRIATHNFTPENNKKDWQQARSCRDVTDGNGNIVIPHLG